VILGIFTIAIFNISGVSVTKYVSSLSRYIKNHKFFKHQYRCIVDITKTLIVWIIGLLITFLVRDSNWENTNWKAILL
jgi:hypothetical protein